MKHGEWLQLGRSTRQDDVVFLVQAGYHIEDALATAAVLESSSIGASLITPLPPTDVARRFRASWKRHVETLSSATTSGHEPSARIGSADLVQRASALVVRNDWGPSRPLVELAQSCSVPTVGWVEGAQDFGDRDTARDRQPYRTVDHVFCLGKYDQQIFADRSTWICGSERLWRAWRGPGTTAELDLVANANFTYGVLSKQHRPWLSDVRYAARENSLDLFVSRHPASRGWVPRSLRIDGDAETVLRRTGRLVTRFSTLVFDALALGVEVIYFNPHGERAEAFSVSSGAFETCNSADQLRLRLSVPSPSSDEVRRVAYPFLAHHVSLDGVSPARCAAAALKDIISLS